MPASADMIVKMIKNNNTNNKIRLSKVLTVFKNRITSFPIMLICLMLFITGCPKINPQQNLESQGPCLFTANRIHIVGLTSIKPNPANQNKSIISVYISMHDSYDSSLKLPGRFMIELYEYVPRSNQPRGKRIIGWPEFDLTIADKNNQHWKDFLRAYNFELPAPVDPNLQKKYILQATCVTPAGNRLTDIYHLNTK